jgi:hypothetical protein
LRGPLNFQPHDLNRPTFDTTRFVTASSLQPTGNIRYFDTMFNNEVLSNAKSARIGW